ncbi:MAG: CBS domain-containing protein [Gemmataceae bacterium]
MICPNCGHDNLPGAEECGSCQQDLTQLDHPVAQNKVERSLMEDPISALAPNPPVTVGPQVTIPEAMQLLLDNNVGTLLVVDESNQLLGILSERDLLTRVAGLYSSYADLRVQDFMTPKPETITANDTLVYAVHKMDVGGYRHLPVLKDGLPAGVISVRDLLFHMTRLCK